MGKKVTFFILSLFFSALFCMTVMADQKQPVISPSVDAPRRVAEPFDGSPNVERVSPGVFRIGSIIMNKAERSVTFPAVVNMGEGLLEYLLVRNDGKTHESLLKTAVDPYHLQIALLLLGLEGASSPIPAQGSSQTPTGEPVEITLSTVQPDGKVFDVKPKAWLLRKKGAEMGKPEHLQFVFTGSIISNGRFMAQVDGSMIAIYRDPSALIDNASPGGEDDEIWYVNKEAVPPPGTPTTVTIKPMS